jgi:hypothetical protein
MTLRYIYFFKDLLLNEIDIAVHFGNDVYFLDETYETGQHIKNDDLIFSSVGWQYKSNGNIQYSGKI